MSEDIGELMPFDEFCANLFKDDKKVVKPEKMIKYGLSFNKPNNWTPLEISFSDVDSYDFSKNFNEYLISEEFVHLYFDFDTIKSMDEFEDVCEWLAGLSEVFGEYSMGGYCDNDEMAEMGFRKYEAGGHWLSMHVVFFETCISSEDLVQIMKHTEKKGFSTDGVHKLCDPNVYKLVSRKAGQTSRQVMRHVLSDKIYKPNDVKNRANHGFILDGLKPSTQIIQIRGSERVITEKEWGKVFKVKKQARITAPSPSVNTAQPVRTTQPSSLDVSERLIRLNDEEMSKLQSELQQVSELNTELDDELEKVLAENTAKAHNLHTLKNKPLHDNNTSRISKKRYNTPNTTISSSSISVKKNGKKKVSRTSSTIKSEKSKNYTISDLTFVEAEIIRLTEENDDLRKELRRLDKLAYLTPPK